MNIKIAQDGSLGYCPDCGKYTLYVKPGTIDEETDFPVVFHLSTATDPKNINLQDLLQRGILVGICNSQTILVLSLQTGNMDEAIVKFVGFVINTIMPKQVYLSIPPEFLEFLQRMLDAKETKSKKYIN